MASKPLHAHRVKCAQCGTPFDAVRAEAAYCSLRCRVAAHRARTAPVTTPVTAPHTAPVTASVTAELNALRAENEKLKAELAALRRRQSREPALHPAPTPEADPAAAAAPTPTPSVRRVLRERLSKAVRLLHPDRNPGVSKDTLRKLNECTAALNAMKDKGRLVGVAHLLLRLSPAQNVGAEEQLLRKFAQVVELVTTPLPAPKKKKTAPAPSKAWVGPLPSIAERAEMHRQYEEQRKAARKKKA